MSRAAPEPSKKTKKAQSHGSRKKRVLKKGRLREDIVLKTKILVLTEAGYRCAVPTCREILLLDMHHIWEVAEGGGDEESNHSCTLPHMSRAISPRQDLG